jgi:iron(III) transport system substrate-binding protein
VPLLVLALVAAACGSSGADGSDGTSAPQSELADALGSANVDAFQQLYDKAKANGETKLVVWDAAAVPNQKLYDAFMKRFPAITVEGQQVNAGDMLTKLNAEQAAGTRSADIAATGSTAMIQGAKANNFQSYSPFTAAKQKGDPVQADANDYFRQYKVGPKGIVYNTSLVKPNEAPKGWNDMLDPKWKGKIAMRNPTVNGGGNELVSDMLYDGRFGYDYLEKLAAQGIKIVSTAAELANAVATGQVAMGIPGDYDTYLDQKDKGAPLGFVWPTVGGAELSELYIGIINGAPHPAAAQLYESWVFSPEGVRTLNAIGTYSPSEQLPDNAPEGLTPYRQLDAFKAYPIADALKYQQDIIPRLKTIFK